MRKSRKKNNNRKSSSNLLKVATAFFVIVLTVLFFRNSQFSSLYRLKHFLSIKGIQLKDYEYEKDRDMAGCDIYDVMREGIANYRDSKIIGFKACSYDDYEGVFGGIISKLVDVHYNIESNFRHKFNLDPKKIINSEFLISQQSYILSFQVKSLRNIKGYSFVSMRKAEDLAKIENDILKSLSNSRHELTGEYVRVNSIKKEVYDSLMSKYALIKDLGDRDLPNSISYSKQYKGIGLFYSLDRNVAAFVNYKNHITAVSFTFDLDIKGTVKNLQSMLLSLKRKTGGSAYSKKYGYLSDDPENLGTNFEASFTLALPTLGSDCKAISALSKELGVEIRRKESSDLVDEFVKDSLFYVALKSGLRMTEVETVNRLIQAVEKIIEKEMEI